MRQLSHHPCPSGIREGQRSSEVSLSPTGHTEVLPVALSYVPTIMYLNPGKCQG